MVGRWFRARISLALGLSLAGPLSGHCAVPGVSLDEAPLPVEFEVTLTDTRDRKGLRRDTWYFVGYQFVAIGILYTMPEDVTGWTAEQKHDYSLSEWWENATHPQMDTDDFYINYILHPYWGAAYYTRARERNYGRREAFWYSFLLSCIYEFGAEALAEEASIQDLIVTPVGGSLLGRYFEGVRVDIREREIGRGYRKTSEKWVMVLTDPLGALNRTVDRLIGYEAELQLYPYAKYETLRLPDETTPSEQREWTVGINFSLRW